jgi:digalactosyldiacylglycerol synthase
VTVVHTSRYTTLTLFWQNSKALSTDPAPLTSKDRYRLSWEAATDRFLDAAELGAEQHTGPGRYGRTGLSQIIDSLFYL